MNDRYSVSVLHEAIELQRKKGMDYNNVVSRVQQADYYPNGVYSILDIMHAKVLRLYSVLDSMQAGGKVQFENLEDSGIDSINYGSFLVSWLRGEIPGQNPELDIFGKPNQSNQLLMPEKFRKPLEKTIS